jgi:histone acetyltransferase (RNA polymerase elongator complex component)
MPKPSEPTLKPFVVPVFIPHAGCPHRCVFCDQTRTTGHRNGLPTPLAIDAAISQFLSYRKDPDQRTEIAYYGGNFLGLPPSEITKLLEIANRYIQQGRADAIRFSTRPDTIDQDRLALVKAYPISTIELGAQSMNEAVLTQSRRGHTAQDTRSAMALLKREPWHTGLQMMVGLAGDTSDTALESGRQLAALHPDFVRIYPCLVLEGSPLARLFAQSRYTPLTLEQAVEQVKALYTLFARAGIPVIRMGLQPTIELNAQTGVIAGPFHPAFGELVHSAVWLAALQQRLAALDLSAGHLEIRVHPHQLSRLNGHKRQNIIRIKLQFGLKTIQTRTDACLPENAAIVNGYRMALV